VLLVCFGGLYCENCGYGFCYNKHGAWKVYVLATQKQSYGNACMVFINACLVTQVLNLRV